MRMNMNVESYAHGLYKAVKESVLAVITSHDWISVEGIVEELNMQEDDVWAGLALLLDIGTIEACVLGGVRGYRLPKKPKEPNNSDNPDNPENPQAPAMRGLNPKDAIGATKIPFSIVPMTCIMDLALALQEGATKYGPFNYRVVPVQMHIYVEAALGHLMSFANGEDIDPYSGLNHVAKCMACCAIILDGLHTNTIVDTRPTKGIRGTDAFSRDPLKVLGDPERIKELIRKPWVSSFPKELKELKDPKEPKEPE